MSVTNDPHEPHLFDKMPGDWWDEGACKGWDPTMWFPERDTPRWKTELAVDICGDCTVRQECLEFAESHPWEDFGIWGGLSVNARRKRRADRNKQAKQEALTNSGGTAS